MRRRTAKKNIVLPDPKFKEVEVTKFVNNLMIDGKKNIAFNIICLFFFLSVFVSGFLISRGPFTFFLPFFIILG